MSSSVVVRICGSRYESYPDEYHLNECPLRIFDLLFNFYQKDYYQSGLDFRTGDV